MSNTRITRFIAITLLAASCALPMAAQTNILLDAPVVKKSIAVRWNNSGKVLQVSLDGGRYHDLASDSMFEGKGPIQVVDPQMNPLKRRWSGNVKAIDDPGFAALADFFKAAQGVTDLVIPKAASLVPAAAGGAACSDPNNDIQRLLEVLYYGENDNLPAYLASQSQSWIDAIDSGFMGGSPGWQAVGAGVTRVSSTATNMQGNIDAANKLWKVIYDCSTDPKTSSASRAVYLDAVLTHQNIRITQLQRVQKAIAKLADSLKSSYVSDEKGNELREKWTGDRNQDYVIQEVTATREKMQQVTVNGTTMSFKFPPDAPDFSLAADDLGSGAFTVQRYSPYIIERSVGAVFGSLKQPTYGTATTADGKTVIARTTDKSLSVNPSIMLNFVCRCAGGLPMLQIGVATSKDLPAFLVGGGIRLFGLGKGDFGLTYGAMMGWYKDLNKLQVGSVVTGTKDIDSDLAFISKPHIKSYFAIQYKF